MAMDESDFLSDIFEKVSHLSRPAPNLTKTGPRRTPTIVDYLCKVAVGFDTIAIRDYGGWLEAAGQERESGLLEQVIAATFQTFEGVDPHALPFQKAAMLLRGIAGGHPFEDGNNRTGFLMASFYLSQIGHPYPETLPVDEVVAFCRQVSKGDVRDVCASFSAKLPLSNRESAHQTHILS